MPPLIAFDLDGTLVDSQRDLADSANEMLAGYGAEPLAVEEVASMVGDGARQLVERALTAAGVVIDPPVALDRFLAIYSARLCEHTRPYSGVPDALAAISGRASLAVLTNKPEGLSRRLLGHFNLSRFFKEVIGGDSPFPRKPNPSGLLHLMRTLGASPAATLMVGDSMVDVETARHANASVCVAQYGFGQLRRPILVADGDLLARRPTDLIRAADDFLWRLRTLRT